MATTSEYVPGGQLRHDEDASQLNVPAGQSSQTDRPLRFAALPASQLVHMKLFGSLAKKPAAQSVHTEAPGASE